MWLQITMITVLYHFLMRLLVGETVTALCRGRTFPYENFWFRQHRFESGLYRFLRVKSWKNKVITARPRQFDVQQRSAEELLFFMTQAEIVHEICMALSFVPLLLIIPYGAAGVFWLTSSSACLIDGAFVAIQRYNRPRVLRIAKKQNSQK